MVDGIYAYAGNDPIDANDPSGLYPSVVVTMPDGSTYTPMTTVKNAQQSRSYGLPIGTPTAIAVPPNVNPNEQVSSWGSTIFSGPLSFAYYWRPGGSNDYKLQNSAYDAYGNFGYGATGTAAGYSAGVLQGVGNGLQLLKNGQYNNPVNTTGIQSGINAIKSGGTLGVRDYPIQIVPSQNGFDSLKLAPTDFGSPSYSAPTNVNTFQLDWNMNLSLGSSAANGGFLIYPNKPNNNSLRSAYSK